MADVQAESVEDAFAKAQGAAFADKGFDVERGIGASDREADCIGAGIDGGNVDRLRHRCAYRQR